jgi:signal transduction histidine kinase
MRRPQKLGARREILILLPATLLLLVLISTFGLFSLRSALHRWQEERRDEAAAIAGRLVRQLGESGGGGGTRPLPGEADLARLAEPVRALGGALALTAGDGATIAQIGPYSGLAPAGRAGDSANSWGPLLTGGDCVAARVPLRGAGRGLVVELPAAALASQLRAVRWLTLIVLPVNAALLLLALFSLQQFLGPWERLLARAEQAAGTRSGDEDEGDFLLATLERALADAPITETTGGEDDLAALERTLAPSLQSGLLLLDRQGEVLALNDLGAGLLGLPPFRPPVQSGPPTGPGVRELLAGRPEVLALVEAAIASESRIQREEIGIESPGVEGMGNRRTILGLSVHPIRRVDGGVRGHLVLFADLTEARQRREQARVAEGLSQLGEMAAGVAHELRNGLATLRGYLTLIDRQPDGESVGDYLAEMRRETGHLERVASDFLDFARPGSARREAVPLDGLLARAAHDPALGGFGVSVTGAPALVASGDEPLLSRALRNLLLNAAEAERRAGGDGPLEIEVEKTSEDFLSISIRDRGPGVPAEIRERLYQPFVTGRPGGVGLGLALAYRIVSLHGGTLDLADREGGGTVATLVLPAA